MYKSLAHFVSILEERGELVRIKERVSSNLEIAEITDRVCKQTGGGKALFFENTDSPFGVLTNMMGSDSRIKLALGVDELEQLGDTISELFALATAPKKGLWDSLKMAPLLAKVAKWMPKKVKGYGSCQQMVMMGDDVDLDLLPILKCAPCDGSRFVTLPLVHTVSPESGKPNVGMYRMQQIDKKTTALHWHKHKTGEKHYCQYKQMGKKMAVSVALGGDPAYTYSATAPLPDGIDEYLLAGFIRGKGVKLVKCLTNDIYVPEDCDFVIEGYVDTQEDKFYEGPFGDHTGFYSLEDFYPIFHVTAITHRRDAIYPATIVGVPPMEDWYIAKATEALFLAPIKEVMQPELSQMGMPMEGVAHNLALLNISKTFSGQGMKVALGMWGAGQMMFNKVAVTTSFCGSVYNLEQLKKQISNVDITKDIVITAGTLDVLDHAAPATGFGGKLAIDATQKDELEGVREQELYSCSTPLDGSWSEEFAKSGWATLFCYLDGSQDYISHATNALQGCKGVKFVVILDPESREFTISEQIWLLLANCDMQRDTKVVNSTLLLDGRSKCGGVNGFNRRWPNVVVMDNNTVERVDALWPKLGLGEVIPSPSLRYKKLLKSDKADV